MESRSNDRNVDAASFYKVLFNRTRNIKVSFTVLKKYFTDFHHTFIIKICIFSYRKIWLKRGRTTLISKSKFSKSSNKYFYFQSYVFMFLGYIECHGVLALFKRSPKKLDLTFKTYTGDRYSNSYQNVAITQPYGPLQFIVKEECTVSRLYLY